VNRCRVRLRRHQGIAKKHTKTRTNPFTGTLLRWPQVRNDQRARADRPGGPAQTTTPAGPVLFLSTKTQTGRERQYCRIGVARKMSVHIDAIPDLLLLIRQKLRIVQYRHGSLSWKEKTPSKIFRGFSVD